MKTYPLVHLSAASRLVVCVVALAAVSPALTFAKPDGPKPGHADKGRPDTDLHPGGSKPSAEANATGAKAEAEAKQAEAAAKAKAESEKVAKDAKESAAGLEKQAEKKAEQERNELDKGSEQGQAKRAEHSRKWWKFWSKDTPTPPAEPVK